MSEEKAPNPKELQDIDFVRGIFYSSTKILGPSLIFKRYDTRLHRAMAESYKTLLLIADTSELDVNFSIQPDPIHGDSLVLEEVFSFLIGIRELQYTDESDRWLKFEADESRVDDVIGQLPGTPELYDEICHVFLRAWRNQ